MGNFKNNVSLTFSSNIFKFLIGIGTSAILARALGPEGKGLYALSLLLPALLITFSNMGIGPSTIYFTSKKTYSLKAIYGANIVFASSISVFAFISGLLIIRFFSYKLFPSVPVEYLFAALFLIPVQIFFVFFINILLGLQKFKQYNFFMILQSLILFFLIFSFLKGFNLSIKHAIIATIISFIAGTGTLLPQIHKHTGKPEFSFKNNIIRNFAVYGLKSYTGNIFAFLHYRIDQFIINILLNPAAVGFYSISAAFSEKILIISQSAATVVFPRISSETDKKRLKEFTPMICRTVLLLTLLSAIIIAVSGKWIIVFFFSEKFMDSVLPFRILLIGTVVMAGAKILANDIAGRGKPEINTYITIGSVFLNIILNLFLIPSFGIVGAAWATVISYLSFYIAIVLIYVRISGNQISDVVFPKKTDFKLLINLLFSIKRFCKHSNIQ